MKNSRDLTSGSIVQKMVLFALPLVGVNLLQAVYNLVDMMIVGHCVGKIGMSAVGIGGMFTHLILVVCNGLSNGGSACMGQLFGAGRMDEAKKLVGSLLTLLAVIAAVLTVLVLVFLHPILNLLSTPAESYEQTWNYLAICAAGTIFIYLYNALAGALRGIGESVHPMIFIMITTVENIVLDLLFVAVLHWNCAGAALATVISQATSLVLVVHYVRTKTHLFDFRLPSFRPHRDKISLLLRIGGPQSIQFVCTNISFLFILSMVNAYGVTESAVAAAANKIWTFGTLSGQACMAALVTMTAQNLPRKNYRRILQGMACGIILSLIVAMLFFIPCQVCPDLVYTIFTTDPTVPAAGAMYLRIYAFSFITECTMFCMFGVLTGAGYTPVTMISAITAAFAVRLTLAYFLSHFTALAFNGIAVAYPIAPFTGIIISTCFLISGRWKKSRIRI